MSSKSDCTVWLPSSGSHVALDQVVWIRSGERGCHTTLAVPAWYSLRRTGLCSAWWENAHNLGVPMLSFSRFHCFDPCILLISTTRLFPLYWVIARFYVGGQSSIFRVEVNFWSQSRGQGFRDLLLQQPEINSMYKKESAAQCSSVWGGRRTASLENTRQTRGGICQLGGQRYKFPTPSLRFLVVSLLHLVCYDNQRELAGHFFWWLPLAC